MRGLSMMLNLDRYLSDAVKEGRGDGHIAVILLARLRVARYRPSSPQLAVTAV